MTFPPPPPLRLCDACARHVFASEITCPFCAAVLAPMPARPRFKLNLRLSRAQRFAIAGAVAGLIGCSESYTPQPEPPYGASFPPGTGGNGTGGMSPGVWMDTTGSGGTGNQNWADGGGAGGAPSVGGGGGQGGDAGFGGGWPGTDEDAGDRGDDGGTDQDAGNEN
jgi:hypothetical protein